jgi:cytochrome c oxidase cbb3-type subunit 1
MRRPLTVAKAPIDELIDTEHQLTRLVFAYLAGAAFWLVVGTLVGLYLSLKFIWPDLDTVSWLSFGRLRPIHTNTVFWGWASHGMVGLAYYVVPRTCRQRLHSYRLGWIALCSCRHRSCSATSAWPSGSTTVGRSTASTSGR